MGGVKSLWGVTPSALIGRCFGGGQWAGLIFKGAFIRSDRCCKLTRHYTMLGNNVTMTMVNRWSQVDDAKGGVSINRKQFVLQLPVCGVTCVFEASMASSVGLWLFIKDDNKLFITQRLRVICGGEREGWKTDWLDERVSHLRCKWSKSERPDRDWTTCPLTELWVATFH